MTELDFLLDLLLNHKLAKATQVAIKDRIAIIQTQIPHRNISPSRAPDVSIRENPALAAQAPSMRAAIAELQSQGTIPGPVPAPPSGQHPTVAAPAIAPPPVATTNAAQQALQIRDQIIRGAIAESGGNFEPGRKAARKF